MSFEEAEIRTQIHIEGNHVKTQGEDGRVPAKERGLRRNHSCQHLDLGLSASRIITPTWKSYCEVFRIKDGKIMPLIISVNY